MPSKLLESIEDERIGLGFGVVLGMGKGVGFSWGSGSESVITLSTYIDQLTHG